MSVDRAVQGLYRTLLGREADPAGKAQWLASFGDVVTVDDFAAFQRAAAAEAPGRTVTIADLYGGFLGRSPSAQDLAAWQSEFGPTIEIGEIFQFYTAALPEINATPAPLVIIPQEVSDQLADAFMTVAVTALYRLVLDREPDTLGLDFWKSQFGRDLETAEIGRFRAAAAMERSVPLTIADLYRGFLDRAPEPVGMAFWQNQFGSSIELDEIATFFQAAKPELQARAQQMVGAAPQEVVAGTANNDNITGTAQGEVIDGLAGNDSINGGLGADTLLGGLGNDTIIGAQDDGLIDGGVGTDTLRLLANFDDVSNAQIVNIENVVLGAAGLVVNLDQQTEGLNVIGSAGNDSINGGAVHDTLDGSGR